MSSDVADEPFIILLGRKLSQDKGADESRRLWFSTVRASNFLRHRPRRAHRLLHVHELLAYQRVQTLTNVTVVIGSTIGLGLRYLSLNA